MATRILVKIQETKMLFACAAVLVGLLAAALSGFVVSRKAKGLAVFLPVALARFPMWMAFGALSAQAWRVYAA